jgi:hypothetical protein
VRSSGAHHPAVALLHAVQKTSADYGMNTLHRDASGLLDRVGFQ